MRAPLQTLQAFAPAIRILFKVAERLREHTGRDWPLQQMEAQRVSEPSKERTRIRRRGDITRQRWWAKRWRTQVQNLNSSRETWWGHYKSPFPRLNLLALAEDHLPRIPEDLKLTWWATRRIRVRKQNCWGIVWVRAKLWAW